MIEFHGGVFIIEELYRKWTVYIHTSPSGKKYIGITNHENPQKRWANGLGYRTQTVFFRSIIKYGWDNFTHEIVSQDLTFEEAKNMEVELIKQYKTNVNEYGREALGYNMTKGGDNVPFYDLYNSANHKIYMNEKVYSKTRIPINVYDLEGNFIKSFESISEASRELGLDKSGISLCCKGMQNRCGKYRFSYQSEQLTKKSDKELTKIVNMFDANGVFIRSFDSCAEAARYVNFGVNKGSSAIAKCAKGIMSSYKGYLWSYESKPIRFRKTRWQNKPVNMYSVDGEFIERFCSIKEALIKIRPGTKSTSRISSCCRGQSKIAYGYIWRYANTDYEQNARIDCEAE